MVGFRPDSRFHCGVGEEFGVVAAEESGRIGERESTKVLLAELISFHEFPRFEENALHIGDIPMPDIGTEERTQASAHGIESGIERHGVHGVVGLAAEEELLGKDPANILGPAKVAMAKLVQGGWVLVGIRKETEASSRRS